MKRTYILIAQALLLQFITGQQQAPHFTLNEPLTGNLYYEARDYIKLLPGFEYTTASSQDEFRGKINPYLLFPPNTGITGGPNPGDHGIVGSLPGIVSVNDLGAATYAIPLQFPPGIGDMTPSVSLFYNSMLGNGLLGWGWTIGGLSAITRTGTTIYHDGYIDGVNFNSNDKLMLDGLRLFETNGGGTEFQTEIENFSKITIMESNAHGPVWFEVRTKNGRIMQYGKTLDSRLKAQGKEQILSWHLNRIEDHKGNHIDYTYIQSNGNIRIGNILYGGNWKIPLPALYEIKFTYTRTRIDNNIAFISGSMIEMRELLDKIEIIKKSSTVKLFTYKVSYDITGSYSRISNIGLMEKNSLQINDTKFIWGEVSNPFNYSSTNINPNANQQKQHYFLGDFNGDGKTDVACAHFVNNQPDDFTHWSVFYNVNGYYFIEKYMGSLQFGGNLKFSKFIPGDFNGDGKVDLVMVTKELNVYKAKYFLSTGGGFTYAGTYPVDSYGPGFYFHVTDMNGNGIHELLHVKMLSSNLTWFGAYEYNAANSTFEPLFTSPQSIEGYSFWHDVSGLFHIKPGDFTGDGKTDLLVNMNELESTIFCLDENANQIYELTNPRFGFPNKYHRVFTGDFNGDGITDILTFAWNHPSVFWELHHFDGRSQWISSPCPITRKFDPEASTSDNNYLVADYNGDGKDDILEIYNKVNPQGSEINVFYSRGISFLPPENQFLEQLLPFISGIHNNHDMNGDGKSDCFIFPTIYSAVKILFFHQNELSNKILSIENGLGVKSSFTYLPLTNNQVYTKGNQAQYPLVDIQYPLLVVHTESHDVMDNHILTKTYRYGSGIIHKTGKGFLGFKKKSVTDHLYYMKTEYLKDFYVDQNKFFFPFLKTMTTFNLQGSKLSEVSNILNHKSFAGSPFVFFPFIEQSFSKEFEYNTLAHLSSSKLTHDYDNYGNLLHERKLLHPEPMAPGAPAQAYHHQTDRYITYYPPNYDHWIIGQPHEITTHERFQNEPILTASSIQTYYGQNEDHFPLLKEVVMYPGNDPNDVLVTKSEFNYDVAGNGISNTLSAPNSQPTLPSKTNIVFFDPALKYRFPTTQTNPAGYTSTFEYDQDYGWQTSSTDFNGLATAYTNHPLGLQSGAVYPDGNRQMQALRWATGHADAPADALYYLWGQSSGEPATLTFYHKTVKELRTVHIGFNGEKTYFDKIYNNRGLIWKESLPYHPGESVYYTKYTYDDPGRVIQVKQPDNSISTIQYNGNEITETNALNQSTTKKYNAAGWLTESIDPAGKSVKNDYFSDGKLKSAYIMGQPQTAVNMEYNSRRQRSVLTDPNYGTATYTYNAYDELITQITPRDHTISYLYDILGRLETQTEPEGTTTWQYDVTPGKLGTLMSVSDGYHVTGYQYDGLLRLMAIDETIGTETYHTSYTYDHFDRMKNTAYPSGFEIEHIYNGYGFLHQIKSAKDKSLLWQTNETNTAGMIKGFQTGNGLQTTREFNPQTLRLENIHTVNSGQNTIQDLEYTWNVIGNLSHRKSWMNTPQKSNLVESFTYDNLSRLENITLNTVQKGAHQYDAAGLGNLIYKQASGQVLFENAQYGEDDYGPHAITSANIVPGVFPAENQQIVYNSYDKVTELSEGAKQLSITYGTNKQRIEQEYDWMFLQVKKRWAGACEYVTINGQQRIITYLSDPEGVFALHVINPNVSESIHYVHKDHLGSWHTITDENGNLLQELSFDAWGTRRNPQTWDAFAGTPPSPLYDRGFTGHEHLYAFGLINMNGRMYDPMVSRMLSPDNFIQSPDFSQSFNRYSYVWNNPLVYTDPEGEIALPVFIGLMAGWYQSAMMASNSGMSFGGAMASIVAGGFVGGLSGYVGGTIATGGGFMANTMAIASTSHINSVGMGLIGGFSGVEVPYTLSFGAASITMSSQGMEFGYLGKPGNSDLENIGYGFGAMANLQDALAAFNKPIIDEHGNKTRPDSKITVNARKEIAGHSWVEGFDINISVGPAIDNKPHLNGVKWESQYLFKTVKGRNFITRYNPKKTFSTTLNNVNVTKLQRMTNFLNDGLSLSGKHSLRYGFWNGCVNQSSRALFRAGVFNFNAFLPITAPVLLNAELALRNYGMMFSYYMISYE